MKILIIDDEQSQRDILADILTDAGYQVECAAGGEEGLQHIFRNDIPLVLTDLKMPDKDKLTVLQETLAFNPDIQVVLMTAFGSIPSAVSAIKSGAYDYLTKPFKKEELLRVIHRAAEKAALSMENRQLREEMSQRFSYHNLIGTSPAMQGIFRLIERIKDIDATVLITGESGTGKELVARAIHFSGSRKNGPFVAVNCGAIPENLIESELFGHEKGSFTGASRSFTGRFEQAQNGTIFLDEIGAMPLSLQVKLLRVLQEKTVIKVGGTQPIHLNVRVISATNENLPDKIKRREFRTDMYHRLNVFSLHLPPLRERTCDISLLTRHFLEKFARKYSKKIPKLSPDALRRLETYSFPGNVRELVNIIEKSLILCDDEVMTSHHLMMPDWEGTEPESEIDSQALPLMEQKLITQALQKNRGFIKKAAEELKISYKTLQYRMKKYGLDKKDFKR
ncbi:MAG: sigma-54 dependent transcriptional regulator [Calditrichia bacterium]